MEACLIVDNRVININTSFQQGQEYKQVQDRNCDRNWHIKVSVIKRPQIRDYVSKHLF